MEKTTREVTEIVKGDCEHDTEQVLTMCEHGAAWYGSPKSTVQVKAIRKGEDTRTKHLGRFNMA